MNIYAITNDVNRKVYVGMYSGKKLKARWATHLCDAKNNSQILIHRAMRKHGIDNFHIISIWSGHITAEKLKELEKYYIRCFQSKRPNGYNLTDGGDGSVGFKHSQETIEKLKNRIVSPETRAKMKEARSKWKPSAEHRQKNRVALMGNKHLLGHFPSEETRRKIGIASKKWHEQLRPKSIEVNNQSRSSGGDGE